MGGGRCFGCPRIWRRGCRTDSLAEQPHSALLFGAPHHAFEGLGAPWCVVEAFWSHERLGLSGDTVPIPLVIADLLASLDSRNIEAAQELRGSWIRGVEA